MLVFLLAGALVFAAWYPTNAKAWKLAGSLEDSVEAARAAGLLLEPKPTSGSDGAWRHYRAAFQSLMALEGDAKAAWGRLYANPTALGRQPTDLRRDLELARPANADLRLALATNSLGDPSRISERENTLTDYSALRSLGRLVSAKATLAAMDGDLLGTKEHLTQLAQMQAHLLQDSNLAAFLTWTELDSRSALVLLRTLELQPHWAKDKDFRDSGKIPEKLLGEWVSGEIRQVMQHDFVSADLLAESPQNLWQRTQAALADRTATNRAVQSLLIQYWTRFHRFNDTTQRVSESYSEFVAYHGRFLGELDHMGVSGSIARVVLAHYDGLPLTIAKVRTRRHLLASACEIVALHGESAQFPASIPSLTVDLWSERPIDYVRTDTGGFILRSTIPQTHPGDDPAVEVDFPQNPTRTKEDKDDANG